MGLELIYIGGMEYLKFRLSPSHTVGLEHAMVKEIASTIGMGTIIPAQGVWRGNMEYSYMLITSEDDFKERKEAIRKILQKYNQECVFILEVGVGYLLYTHEEVVV